MKQIIEDYCSFEVAKLLKEKGFDEICSYEWGIPDIDKGYVLQKWTITNGQIKNSDLIDGAYTSPTHQMALKWLRKVHNIVLDIAFEANKGWTFYVSHLIIGTISDGSTYIVGIQHSVWSDDVQQPYYKEYEEAVDAALLYALKNLI